MEKTAELKTVEKGNHSINLTLNERDNLDAALGKLTALLHTMNDAICSGNEIEHGDFLWLFIYAYEELDIIKNAVKAE